MTIGFVSLRGTERAIAPAVSKVQVHLVIQATLRTNIVGIAGGQHAIVDVRSNEVRYEAQPT